MKKIIYGVDVVLLRWRQQGGAHRGKIGNAYSTWFEHLGGL